MPVLVRTVKRLLATTAALSVVGGLALTAGTPLAPAAAATPKVSKANLLRAHDFLDRGFAKADTLDNWEGPGYVETLECGTTPVYRAHGYRNQRQRMFLGRQTEAEELVVQFRTSKQAKSYVRTYRKALTRCERRLGKDAWNSSGTRYPQVDASEAMWWQVRVGGYDWSHRAVAVVRSGRRVALLELQSETSKPWQTTNVVALMQEAAWRL